MRVVLPLPIESATDVIAVGRTEEKKIRHF